MITVTDDSHDRFWRADAVEILVPSPDRIEPRCAISGPGLCGGCDFQHVDLAAQRQLKQQVVAEQLQRLAGITWHGEVEEVTVPATEVTRPEPVEGPSSALRQLSTTRSTSSGIDAGLGWRTRMRYQVDDQGRAGLRVHRSHEVIALPPEGCPIADPRTPEVTGRNWTPGFELIAAATSTGQTALFEARTARNQPPLVERAAGRDWRVAADGFWQVHPAAAQTLVDAVIDRTGSATGRAGVRPLLRRRAVRRCAGGRRLPGLGDRVQSPGDPGCPAQPARRGRPAQADDRSSGSRHRTVAAPGRSGRAGSAALRRGSCDHHPTHVARGRGRSRTWPATRRHWRATSAPLGTRATSRSASEHSISSR